MKQTESKKKIRQIQIKTIVERNAHEHFTRSPHNIITIMSISRDSFEHGLFVIRSTGQ